MQRRSGTRTTPPNLSEPSALTVFRVCNGVSRSRNEYKVSPYNRCKRDGLLRLPVTAIPSSTQALSMMLPSPIYFYFSPQLEPLPKGSQASIEGLQLVDVEQQVVEALLESPYDAILLWLS